MKISSYHSQRCLFHNAVVEKKVQSGFVTNTQSFCCKMIEGLIPAICLDYFNKRVKTSKASSERTRGDINPSFFSS